MKYFKITCSNGYCGCDEEWYEVADDSATESDFECDDYLQSYGFYEPDARFVDPDDYVEKNVYGGLVSRMEEENLDMLRFNYRIVDEQYREMEKTETMAASCSISPP